MNFDESTHFKMEDLNSSDDENYKIQTKVCKRLSKELNLPEINIDETINCLMGR